MKRLTIGTRACTEILALLIHIAWADGKLAEEEKTGIRAAASVFNLSKEQRDRLDAAMKNPLPFDQLLFDTLSPHDRAFAYVAAAWMSGIDDDVDPKEVVVLEEVATALELDHAKKDELTQLARDLEPAHRANASWSDSLVTLFRSIPPRLDAQSADAIDVAFETD